jgi:hypothetical protein
MTGHYRCLPPKSIRPRTTAPTPANAVSIPTGPTQVSLAPNSAKHPGTELAAALEDWGGGADDCITTVDVGTEELSLRVDVPLEGGFDAGGGAGGFDAGGGAGGFGATAHLPFQYPEGSEMVPEAN